MNNNANNADNSNQILRSLRAAGLVIATHNQGKLREIQELLAPLHINCISAAEKILPEPEENGDTFIQNAMIKSVAAAAATDMPSLADDSGLVVPNLGGDPGIYSARWAGPDKNFDYAMRSVRVALEAKEQPLDSEAYFVCVLSLALPSGFGSESLDEPAMSARSAASCESQQTFTEANKIFISTATQDGIQCLNVESRVYGKLSFPPRGDAGFGYDPIFTAKGMVETFAEIDPSEKRTISHRANAFAGLMDAIGE